MLGIILRSYDPSDIYCYSQPQRYDDDECATLLNTIPAEVVPSITWGPVLRPGVDMKLPTRFKTHGKYFFTIQLYFSFREISTPVQFGNKT